MGFLSLLKASSVHHLKRILLGVSPPLSCLSQRQSTCAFASRSIARDHMTLWVAVSVVTTSVPWALPHVPFPWQPPPTCHHRLSQRAHRLQQRARILPHNPYILYNIYIPLNLR